MTAPPSLYLEDLHVGQTFVTPSVAVTTDEIKAFARQFDPQPFHLDEDAARDSLFSAWRPAAGTRRR